MTIVSPQERDVSQLLGKEVEYAARLQRASMPDALPRVPGYRFTQLYQPCGPLGGDFFDFAISDQALRILLADVSGHGIGAALCTMLVKSIFHRAAEEHDSPPAILTAMNGSLHRDLPEGMFVAAGILCIDLVGDSLLFSNAGLPFPFVLEAFSGRTIRVPAAGNPLGLFSDRELSRYTATRLHLEKGDVLLLATDGLSARLGNPEDVDDGRLEELLGDHTGSDGTLIVQKLAGLVSRAVSSTEDDLSLIAATRCSPAATA